MRHYKRIHLVILLVMTGFVSVAQKEVFDVVSYTPVSNWKKDMTENYVSFSTTDEGRGSFCSIIIYKSANGVADSKTNFDNSWKNMLAEPVGAGNPRTEAVALQNGWELQTGSSAFSKNGLSGTAILITATAASTMINLTVLYNSEAYNKAIGDFIGSIEIKALPTITTNSSSGTTGTAGNGKTDVTGLWRDNLLETSGYLNGMPMYTAGYFRKEYTFKNDGTYLFMRKNWTVTNTTINFQYETGTYTVSGNTLTLFPKAGKSQSWSKAPSGRTTDWGSLLKSVNMKLEKTSYNFSIEYYPGSKITEIRLVYDKPTEREMKDQREQNGKIESRYSLGDQFAPLITPPPGLKIEAVQATSPDQHTIKISY